MKSAMVHGVAVHISYRSVSGGARCFLSSLVRRSRLSAPSEPFQASLKTRIRAGSLGRCGGGSCGLCGSRVHWFVFGGIFRRLPCVHGVFMVIQQSPWNAAEERRRGRNGGTTFRLDSLGTLVYGVNIFLLIEIFTL